METVQSAGKVCILDIDVQGVQNVKKSSLSAIYVFIAPPSMDELEQRLRGRATESEEDIQRRLGNAAKEIQYGTTEGNFDKVFVNGDLVKTFEQLVKAVKAWYPHLKEHMRPRPVVFAGPSGVGKVSSYSIRHHNMCISTRRRCKDLCSLCINSRLLTLGTGNTYPRLCLLVVR